MRKLVLVLLCSLFIGGCLVWKAKGEGSTEGEIKTNTSAKGTPI